VKIKVFSQGTVKEGHARMEALINERLAAHPEAKPVIVEKIAHPGFGWGHFVVSVWYEQN
jgi:hypothetical protein